VFLDLSRDGVKVPGTFMTGERRPGWESGCSRCDRRVNFILTALDDTGERLAVTWISRFKVQFVHEPGELSVNKWMKCVPMLVKPAQR
jgi:hypothetical protein